MAINVCKKDILDAYRNIGKLEVMIFSSGVPSEQRVILVQAIDELVEIMNEVYKDFQDAD